MTKMIDIPPVWLAAALLAAWLQTALLPVGPAPGMALKGVGWGLIMCGVGLIGAAAWAFWRFKTTIIPHQTPQRIMQSGVFARSRNPIYLGDAFILAGAILVLGAWPSVVVVPMFVWWIGAHFIAAEEARMREAFGAEFEDYVQKVRRWV